MLKIKFLNILFFAIPESECDFIAYRHELESTAFSELLKTSAVKFLKLHESGYTPRNYSSSEFFFKGRNKFFHFPLSMYLFIRREKPDVLFVHSFIFPFQLLFLKFFVPKNTKIIVQHHAEKPFINPIKSWFQKLAYPKADAYLFSSQGLAKAFVERGIIRDEQKIHEVMEGSALFSGKDKTTAREKLNIKEEIVFLWVGRLNENKDPLSVLRAMEQYKEKVKNFKLYMIYGSFEMEAQIKRYILEKGLASYVTLIGKIPHPELEDWYNASDYFIAASHYEGSGIALCEAMACGCIPVVTNIPSFKSMLNGGECGYMFEPGSDQGLLSILLSLDHSKINLQKDKVIKKFEKDLSFPAIGRKISSLIVRLLENQSKP